tara:strand:+ start:1376 stop:2380 length:1005 start_codon:yes stop_codon:yes gene_type:complete
LPPFFIWSDELTKKNDVYLKAMGGTELLRDALLKKLPAALRDNFNFILSRVRDEFFDDRPTLLWLHDTAEDPESAHLTEVESRTRFEKLVFVSNWQQYSYVKHLNVPYEDGIVIKNAIEPIPVHSKPKGEKIKLIYFSTPHRGLVVLQMALELLSKQRDDFEVDVYSSFDLYGWEGQDEQKEWKVLFDKLREMECVNYYGTVSNDKIREALTTSHIFAYPSVYQETSCLCAIEAMTAGCLAVVPNFGALTETCGDFAWMYNWESDPVAHAQKYAYMLNTAIDSFWEPGLQSVLGLQSTYYNYFYSWDARIPEWVGALSLIERDLKRFAENEVSD